MTYFSREWDAVGTAEAIQTGRVTPLEIVDQALAAIDALNDDLRAVIHVYADEARTQAKALTDFSAPFAGVPILLKDAGQNYAGHPATFGSALLADNRAQETDNFVQAILDAGFIVVGHTNVPEFALKHISDSEYYGSVRNLVDRNYHAGGSSGGAAAALQAGMVPVVTASDGGGSIRIPASFSGLIGLKPTRGRTVAGPGSYRNWGGASVNFFLTKSVRDTRALMDVVDGRDCDPIAFPAIPLDDEDYIQGFEEVKSLRLAYTTRSFSQVPVSQDAVDAVLETVDFLRSQGFHVEEAHPEVDGGALLEGYLAMNAVEQHKLFQQLAKGLGRSIVRGEVEDLSLALATFGEKIPAWRYSQAFDEWDQACAQMTDFHQEYDLLIQPATAKTAQPLEGEDSESDVFAFVDDLTALPHEELGQLVGQAFSIGSSYSPFAYIYNLTGQPAISLPLYTSDHGLPLGVMFSARKHQEDLLLAIARYLEETNRFHYYANQKE